MKPHILIVTYDDNGLMHGVCPVEGCGLIMWETPEHYTRKEGGMRVIINGRDTLWPHTGWGMQDIIPFDLAQEVKKG